MRLLKSHIFLLPSLIENSPNSLGEALLLGVPAVCSNVGGVKDFIQMKESGYLYPVDNCDLCAEYILELFEMDREQLESISNSAIHFASKVFDEANNARALIDIYETIKNK